MGRRRRPFLPGGIFHLTARTIRWEQRFTPRLRAAALDILAQTLPRSGARLLAVAIMSNHLHVVAQQGDKPLATLMQPFLRRLARSLQWSHDLDGPVFWRPYASQPCLNPVHARNAIVYTHLNPARAGLCKDPREYPWTSHPLYADASAGALPKEIRCLRSVLDPHVGLSLFAAGPHRSAEELHGDYRAFVDWRLQLDQIPQEGGEATSGRLHALALAELPDSRPGMDWGLTLSPLFHAPVRPGSRSGDEARWGFVPDLATIARNTLSREAPDLSIEMIRGRGGGRGCTRLRRLIIWRLHTAGYRNVEIAQFLDLSESTVSATVRGPLPER